MQKVALITGVTGQDGSYMADLLLEKGYKAYGMVRRSASPNLWRISHILDKLEIVEGDLTDQSSLENIIQKVKPDEIYNFAAQSFVQYSFQSPVATSDATGTGVLRLLEATRIHHRQARFLQASSSEMFGKIQETPQKETTRFYTRSPYGVAKAYAHYITVNYRESYKIHASCAIMFNHESPRRGEEFVTRKITKGIAEFKKTGKKIILGNLNASRDWSYSPELMEACWKMVQLDKPTDLVLGSGITHTVKEWLEETCRVAGVDFWEVYSQSPTMERQSEVDYLRADPSLADSVLGWKTNVSFQELVRLMYEADYKALNGLEDQ